MSFRVPKYYGDSVEHKSIISEVCVDPNAKKMIIIFTSNSDQNKIRILYKETTLIRWTIEVFGFLSEKII